MLTLFVIVIVVIADRYQRSVAKLGFLTWLRSSNWFEIYLRSMLKLLRRLSSRSEVFQTVFLLVPLLLSVGCTELLAKAFLGEVGKVLFAATILYYCLGNSAESEYKSEFIAAHEQAFAILFWFVCLGPVAAMTYWLLMVGQTSRMISHQAHQGLFDKLEWLHGLAAWLPARITGLIYALVGNFTSGFQCWQSCMQMATMHSSQVLIDCGQAALHPATTGEETNIVKRALVAWLFLCAFIALVK